MKSLILAARNQPLLTVMQMRTLRTGPREWSMVTQFPMAQQCWDAQPPSDNAKSLSIECEKPDQGILLKQNSHETSLGDITVCTFLNAQGR